ncbi:MAG: cytidylate kinase-like family protein [Clostridia bacterium]|nr:cytidylate kinase-like family protein [Clostridia bacterium]
MVITIGREFGSGGRELGRLLAETLGIEYYDKEIIAEIAKNTELSEQYVKQVVEKNPHELFPITVAHTFSYIDTQEIQQKQMIFMEQEKVIKKMAETSDCVIVGRCADYILQDFKPFRIFVYADMDSKVERCLARSENPDELPRKKLIKQIKSIDKNRARYYNYYTGKTWGDMLNYDICINTTNVNISDLVPHIAKMVKG